MCRAFHRTIGAFIAFAITAFSVAPLYEPPPAFAAATTYSATGTITVSAAATTSGLGTSAVTGDATLNVTDLQSALGSGDVTISAGEDVRVESAITYASSSSLTLTGSRHIRFTSGSDLSATGSSDLELQADSAGSRSGIIYLNEADISTTGGSILLDGNSFFQSSSSHTFSSGGGNITIDGETLVANSHADGLTIDSSGGDVTVGILNSANAYEFVDKTGSAGSGSWDEARTEAKSTYVDGDTVGDEYLVTITSELENSIAALTAGYVGAWIGAYRPGGVKDPNWLWADGPERNVNFFDEDVNGSGGGSAVSDRYNNFDSGEPNGGDTNGEQVGQFFGEAGEWNDLARGTDYSNTSGSYNVLGFIRETNLANSKVTVDSGSGILTKGTVGATKDLDLYSAPDVPTSLDGAASDVDGEVDLTWTAPSTNNSAITSYSLRYRVAGSGGSWTAATDTDGSTTDAQATISGLNSCVAYEFQVLATNALGSSSYSTSTTVTSFSSDDLSSLSSSQLVTAGDTTLSAGTYTLTPDEGNKKGAVWSGFRLDLSESFCLEADLKLSADEDLSGADGIAFVLQPSDTSSLSAGGGLGYYSGVKPSVVVEFDTYNNGAGLGDVSGQDISFVTLDAADPPEPNWTAFDQATYNVSDPYQLEDGEFHALRIRYDADQELFTTLFDLNADGDFSDAGERVIDGVSADLAQYFSDQATTQYAYWGFTAATGGATNLQAVKSLKAFPAALASNTAPTATSPGAQTVDVGASKNITVTIGDSGETTAAQWRLSVASGNETFATTSVTTASATQATVSVTGVADGDTTITLTAVDADGASVTTSFALRVGAGSPSTPTSRSNDDDDDSPAPVVSPAAGGGSPAILPRRAVTPPQTNLPVARQGPVLRNGVVPRDVRAPEVRIGGQATSVQSTVTNPSNLSVRAGVVSLGVRVQQDEGSVSQSDDGTTEVSVRKGAKANISGEGFRPESTVQVFLPLEGRNAKELTRIPVAADGSFDGDAVFATRPDEDPLPVGRQVLQLVSIDQDGNEAVVDMTVNIAQPPPAPELNRVDGVIPAQAPGTSIATNAGVPEEVRVSAVEEQKLAVVEGDGWSMAIAVAAEDGGVQATDGGASLTLVRNETARVSGDGFMPGTRADVWLFSEPTLLGTVTIDDEGRFDGEVNIDGRVIAVGNHTLQLQGVGEDGYVRAANMGVTVGDPAEVVPTAEENSLMYIWWVLAALVLMALVIVFWIAANRRRQA